MAWRIFSLSSRPFKTEKPPASKKARGGRKIEARATRPGSVRVTGAEHGGEGHDLFLAAAPVARLLVVTLGANAANDVFALELLFHAAERTVNRLVFADFDFDGHE